MFYDSLFIVLSSLATTLLAEAISWALVYRTESYKRTVQRITQLTDKIVNHEYGGKTTRAHCEEELKTLTRSLQTSKFKTIFVVGIVMYTVYNALAQQYNGIVVARLPFTPISMLQGLSHRNLIGSDMRECSFFFLYMLCTIGIRSNVQKLLGFAPPRSPLESGGMFAPDKSK